jgi:hypothetical protein
MGLHHQFNIPLPAHVGYEGQYVLLFEKAVAAWWIGRKDESIQILGRLNAMDIDPAYRSAVQNNLERIGNALI